MGRDVAGFVSTLTPLPHPLAVCVQCALTDAPIWVKSKAGNQQFANGLDKQVFGKEKVSGKTRLRAAIYRRRSPCRFSHV